MKKDNKEVWIAKMKERLDDYSEAYPVDGWANLERDLTASQSPKKVIFRPWRLIAAAVVLLAVVTSVSLYFLGTEWAQEVKHTSTPAVAVAPDALPSVSVPQQQMKEKEFLSQHKELPLPHKQSSSQQKQHVSKSAVAQHIESPVITGDHSESIIEPINERINEPINEATTEEALKKKVVDKESAIHGEISTEPDAATPSKDQHTTSVRKPSGRDKLHLPVATKKTSKGWSVGLAVGGVSLSSQQNGMAYNDAARLNLAYSPAEVVDLPSDKKLIFNDGVPYLVSTNDIVDIKHRQPITFGLSIRKGLGGRFSLESGITYSYLSSDVRFLGNDRMVEQKLHYLGVPIRLNYDLIDHKAFTFYVSGGGAIERCVYGTLDGEKLSVDPLQLSVSAMIGAQVNLTKHLGLYVEPGVAYFFNDGADLKTIRKDRPFNFNLQGGIRFTY